MTLHILDLLNVNIREKCLVYLHLWNLRSYILRSFLCTHTKDHNSSLHLSSRPSFRNESSLVHNLGTTVRDKVKVLCTLTFTDVEMSSRIRSRRCKMTVPISTTSMVALSCAWDQNRGSRWFSKEVRGLGQRAPQKIKPTVPTSCCFYTQ